MVTRKEWIAALRSGKYKQGEGKLRDPVSNKFCCLGVACDLAGTKWSKYRAVDLMTTDFEPVGHDELYAELGLTQDGAIILGSANDNGNTFAQIADVLEKDLSTRDMGEALLELRRSSAA